MASEMDPKETKKKMHWDTREPCAKCPYRKDAPIGLWDPEEFLNLVRNDADPIEGRVFGCHGTAKKPEGPSICGGWLLDQKRRGLPSIQLRLDLISSNKAYECLEQITDGGHALYKSIDEMCLANTRKLKPSEKRRTRK